ncbi:hypothetical protein [Metabacillus litoralis]|jgi:hypothetical protein|uniref:hypothetical protein n=1 Tax=Metabacillus litoralis TaxID=152268 RepID=UPI00203FB8E2|nr:hypothetical protein [Metabacillus litoralis]MCM3651498.1 hypothetical protein [Metabacillus litoralis]
MRIVFFLFTIVLFSLTGCGVSSDLDGSAKMTNEVIAKEQNIISIEATYIGLMDPHSIEVIIDHKPIAIQINEEQFPLFEQLKTNEQIYIEYYYNDETTQNILTKVEIIND